KRIILQDAERKVVVVSAPGRRNHSDDKITDLLYNACFCAKNGGNCKELLDKIKVRFNKIKIDHGATVDVDAILDDAFKRVGADDFETFAVSRGEYIAARIMAELIGYSFADAAEVISIDYNGRVNIAQTAIAIKKRLEEAPGIVVPGFYGGYPSGGIRLFNRGGSDVTGAVIASAVGAEIYEKWTDVDGVMTADPRLVESPSSVLQISYERLSKLSRLGATVLHEQTLKYLEGRGIPVVVKNTCRPLFEGTLIVERLSGLSRDCVVLKSSGFSAVSFSFCGRESFELLDFMRKRGVILENCYVSDDELVLFLKRENTANRCVRDAIDKGYAVKWQDERVALVSLVSVGDEMDQAVITSAYRATCEAKVKPYYTFFSSKAGCFYMWVNEDDAGAAVRALHSAVYGD
ncbi:MAG: hypothetical protein IKC36_04620, partial [Clostridia bacterium]|nr:hypothetical protein [Clostridia bacterium]